MCNERRWVVLVAALAPLPALAYIDPGTGGMIVGGLGALLAWGALLLVTVRRWIARIAAPVFRFVARHRIASIAVVVLGLSGAAALILFPGVPPAMKPALLSASRFDRVLAIGVDGADPRVIQELFDEGLLPNLRELAERGDFRPLRIPNPAQSPVVWAALATGQNPGQNGIYDFIARDPKTYEPRLSLLAGGHGTHFEQPIRARAFWDVTTEHQVPAVVLRWPMTFPPAKIHGRMLAGLGVPDVRGSLGRYTFYTDRPPPEGEEGRDKVTVVEVQGGEIQTTLGGPRVRALTGVKTLTVPLTIKVDPARRAALVSAAGKSFALAEGTWSDWVELTFQSGLFAKHRGMVKLHLTSAAEPFALLATSVEMHPDEPISAFTYPKEYAAELRGRIGLYHTLGMPEDTKAYGEGRLSEAAFLQLCRDVEAERRAMLLAELERFDRGVLAVVFDTLDRIQHMTPARGPLATSPMGQYLIEFDRFLGPVLERLGSKTPVLVFSDHGFSEFHKAVDLNRWLVEQGELALDEEKHRARAPGSSGELFAHVRWDRTRAYALGFAGIHVNVEGREGQGIVPPAERESVAAAIAARLEQLVDPQTGERVVHKVYRREELYKGQLVEEAPDLIVGYRPGYRGSWQSAIGGLADQVLAPNEKRWQRDHIVDSSFVSGTLITNFALKVDDPHAYDLAPTLLSLLGLPVSPEMEGRPLRRIPEEIAMPERRKGAPVQR